jgi:hypothetical protein
MQSTQHHVHGTQPNPRRFSSAYAARRMWVTTIFLPISVAFAAPSAVSISPGAGAGWNQVFTATYSDPAGYGNMTDALFLVQTSVNGAYPNTFSGQAGPANGLLANTNSVREAQINDGSRDSGAVRAFNTLEGKDVSSPVFWENIGSNITFSPNGGTSPQLVLQPYPTYYEFHNGTFVTQYPEAALPLLNFNPNPYPSGTVPCQITSPLDSQTRVTPGGRCGDQASAPDVSARTPSYVQP